MPRVASDARARILQRLELKPTRRETDARSIGEQALSVRRHEVSHRTPFPDVTVEPEAAVHGMDHPLATQRELAIWSAVVVVR
jgi:hypothetical protein